MTTLGEMFPKEQARLRLMLTHALECGPGGIFLARMLEDCLRRADKAAIEQDLPAMIRVYHEMQEFEE